MRVPFHYIGAIQMLAVLSWASLLVFSTGLLGEDPALMYASGLLLLGTVAVVGLAISHGRWAYRLSFAVIGVELVAAVLTPTSIFWWMAASGTGLAVATLVGPWIEPHVRQLPPPAPLPAESMALMLGLLSLSPILAVTDDVDAWVWLLVVACVVMAWAYGRALVAGLWAARLAAPVIALPAVMSGGLVRGVVVVVSISTLTYLAWTSGARNPVVPLDPRQIVANPVFPEMTPPDVLDAAGYDERGRPKG